MCNCNKLKNKYKKEKMTMMENKEIKPVGFNVLVQPYNENPYMNYVSEGGLQLTNGEFQNPDNGEVEKMKSDICCGLVIEVGAKCTEVKVGDEVFFDIRTSRPIPFMNKGFLLTHEPGLICIIAENLQERFLNK